MGITADQVVAVWDGLSSHYSSEIRFKPDSAMMKNIGWALQLMGIQKQKQFMKNYSTTIFDTIYLPFEPGEDSWPYLAQVINGAHEHVHVEQCQEIGPVEYAARYLADKDDRAHFEAKAYITELEIVWNLFKRIPDTREVAKKILDYGCSDTQAAYVKGALDMAIPTIKQGGLITEASKITIRILEQTA